jgi:hypothetical protein
MPLVRRLRSWPCAPLLLACACQGPPPEQVRLELPELVVSNDPARATVHVRRAGASAVSHEKMEFGSTPGDVARITPDGTITCQKTGDAKVTVSVQGVKDDETLRCRLVDRLEVGTLPPFDLTQPPLSLGVRALTKAGAELNDVPITLSAESPRLLGVSGAMLTPLVVGTTQLTVHAGGKTQKFPVRIVRTVTSEALPIEGGRRIFYSLPAGKYEVDVELPAEKELGVEWRGAPYCSYKGRGKTHQSVCVLQNKGGAVVDNPAYLATGDTAVTGGGVTIREVP